MDTASIAMNSQPESTRMIQTYSRSLEGGARVELAFPPINTPRPYLKRSAKEAILRQAIARPKMDGCRYERTHWMDIDDT